MAAPIPRAQSKESTKWRLRSPSRKMTCKPVKKTSCCRKVEKTALWGIAHSLFRASFTWTSTWIRATTFPLTRTKRNLRYTAKMGRGKANWTRRPRPNGINLSSTSKPLKRLCPMLNKSACWRPQTKSNQLPNNRWGKWKRELKASKILSKKLTKVLLRNLNKPGPRVWKEEVRKIVLLIWMICTERLWIG